MRTAPAQAPLSDALEEAIAGRDRKLRELLARGSRLPGTRANDALAEAFAEACRGQGQRAEGVALALARMDADAAPGGTALEFLPVCGVLALGARAAADAKARPQMLAELHARADDLRFRVRDAVVDALARAGGAAGDALVGDVASWMDGYFHAAAVLRALGRETWLASLHDAAGVLARLDEAFMLARDATRAAARYPGHKALVEALHEAPALIAARFGLPVFDQLVRWSVVEDPVMREIVAAPLESRKLAGRFGPDLERVRRALDASRAPVRNPDHDHGPSRDRSGARRAGRRR
jgi:hypothetical protein